MAKLFSLFRTQDPENHAFSGSPVQAQESTPPRMLAPVFLSLNSAIHGYLDFSSVGWCVGKQLRLSSDLDDTYFAKYSK